MWQILAGKGKGRATDPLKRRAFKITRLEEVFEPRRKALLASHRDFPNRGSLMITGSTKGI